MTDDAVTNQSGQEEAERGGVGLTRPRLVSLITDANDYFFHLEHIKEKILSRLAAKQSSNRDNSAQDEPDCQIESE